MREHETIRIRYDFNQNIQKYHNSGLRNQCCHFKNRLLSTWTRGKLCRINFYVAVLMKVMQPTTMKIKINDKSDIDEKLNFGLR